MISAYTSLACNTGGEDHSGLAVAYAGQSEGRDELNVLRAGEEEEWAAEEQGTRENAHTDTQTHIQTHTHTHTENRQ